jgi:outer membrane protein OmpA-like peptidoglycan-associated protein
MSAEGAETQELERLRALLFGPDAARLANTEGRVENLESFVGDASRLEAATARVLVEAFKRAEVDRHRELALAVAPVVVSAIRAELVNSRDMMVEALYPITGRLVTAAVANAFKELVESINQRIDALTSGSQWKLRLKALASGRSFAEVALAEARGAQCARAMLIERGGGKLLAQWRPRGERDDNPELISGLIAAITEFASSVFADRRGELRNLDLGASRIYLRASSRVILAAEMVGSVTSEQERAIDARFMALVGRHDRGEALSERDLADVAAPGAAKKKRSRALQWAVIGVVAALALGLALRGPVYRWRKASQIDLVFRNAKTADARLAAYPLRLSEDWTAGTVDIKGLAPSREAVNRLVVTLTPAAAPLSVNPHVEVVPPVEGLEALQARAADLASSLDAQESRARAIADRLGAAEQANAALRADLAAKIEAVNAAIARTGAGASSALASAVATLRSESAKLDDDLKAAQSATHLQGGEIAELGRTIGALHAHLDETQGQVQTDFGDVRSQASALSDRLTALQTASDGAARRLDGALAQARENAAKAAATQSRLEALGAALAATEAAFAAKLGAGEKATAGSLQGLRDQLAGVSATLDAVRANEARTEAVLGDEAARARAAAQEAERLKTRVETAASEAAHQANLAKASLDDMAAKVAVARQAAADARSEADELRARVDAATRTLPEVARRSIVYFGDNDNFTDPAAAASVLDRLAEAIEHSGEGVRVIGYADETGAPAQNMDLSQARADKVAQMLVARGAPAAKVIAVGRGAMNALSSKPATLSRNRRVVFEPLYPGEAP